MHSHTHTHIRVRSRFTHTPRIDLQTTRTMQSNSDVGGAPTKHTSTRHGLCHRTRECISALHLPPDTRFAIKSVNTADEAASCITWDYPALLPHAALGIIDNWRGAERWRRTPTHSAHITVHWNLSLRIARCRSVSLYPMQPHPLPTVHTTLWGDRSLVQRPISWTITVCHRRLQTIASA